MRLEEIEKSLPNGFHDSYIEKVSIDYPKQEASFSINIWTGDLSAKDKSEKETCRKASLTLSELHYFVVEPPDPKYPYDKEGALWMDAGPVGSVHLKTATKLPDEVPEGAFRHWFYIRN
jgi:hypothetical protein